MTTQRNQPDDPRQPLVLLTGATGYVGGRLLEALEDAGARVRCTARRPEHLRDRVKQPTEVVHGDCLDASSLEPALSGVDTAFYLVHSLGAGKDFEERDRRAAQNFGSAARQAGVRRIIYLGGLGDPDEQLSPHLKSRQDTGDTLRASGVPVIELRASIVLGSGSLSFEMIRALVERLPLMVCPRWVRRRAQPIHIQDVVSYLVGALRLPGDSGRVYEIGGADAVCYVDIMREYARQRGLRRWMVPVPFLTPYLSSLWLGLTTPLYARVGRKLIESIRHPTVVRDNRAREDFDVRPAGLAESIRRAIANEDRRIAATRWSDAVSSAAPERSWGGVKFGTRLADSRSTHVPLNAGEAFAPIRRIGGETGWYHANLLWRIRGFIDLLLGGPGLRRGRRNPENVSLGDPLDCWRVEAYEPDRLLRLSAEMKLPGRAWLEFEVKDAPGGGSTIHQTAVFDPVGLFGQIYWYGIYPLHDWVFRRMVRAIAARAVADARNQAPLLDEPRRAEGA